VQVALAAMLAVGMPGRSEAVDGDPQTPPSTSHTPRWQAEAWYFLQNTTHTTEQQRMTLRLYQPFMLGNGWQLTMREDIRGLDTNQKGVDNPDGLRGAHLGDSFAQASLKTPGMAPGLAVDFGIRVQFPTGNLPPYGTGRFQIGPHLGFIWDLPTPVSMVTLAPLVRYMQSFGDTPANSTATSEIQFHPVIAVKPLTGLTVAFWREHPLILDTRDNKWFIPFDVIVSYEIVPHLSVGVGVAASLVAQAAQYDNIVYGRVVFSF